MAVEGEGIMATMTTILAAVGVEFIPFNWVDVGGWSLFIGLCVAIVVAFMRGTVVPRSVVNIYKEALDASRESERIKDETINELLQHNRTSTKVLKAIQAQPPAQETKGDT